MKVLPISSTYLQLCKEPHRCMVLPRATKQTACSSIQQSFTHSAVTLNNMLLIYTRSYRVFFPYLTDKLGPDAVILITLSEGYCDCDRLSSFRLRLFNLHDTRCTTQRWPSVVREVGPTVDIQAGKETLCIW